MIQQIQCPSKSLFVHVTLSWLATLSVEDLRKVVYMHQSGRAVVIRIGSLTGSAGVFMLYDHRVFSITTVRMSCRDLEWQRSVLLALGQPVQATWKQTQQYGTVIQLHFPETSLAQHALPEACLSVFWLARGAVRENQSRWHWSTAGNGVLASDFHLFLTDPDHRLVARGHEYDFEASDRVRPIWKADKRRQKNVVPGPAFQPSKPKSVPVPVVAVPPEVVPHNLPVSTSSTPVSASDLGLERILPSVEALLPWRPEQSVD